MIELQYHADSTHVVRRCATLLGTHETRVPRLRADQAELPATEAWLRSYLRGAQVENVQPLRRVCTVVDAFSGCGGFALGVRNGLQAAGVATEILASIDMDAPALSVYKSNLGPHSALLENVNSLVDHQVRGAGEAATFPYFPTVTDPRLAHWVGKVDLFIAGPPCQGHSNLNNQTRRSDPRNLLYVTAAATGVALKASAIVIENVPTVIRSHKGVVVTARALLERSGYSVTERKIDASVYGCAQARQRHFLFAIATGNADFILSESMRAFQSNKIPVSAALDDLLASEPRGVDEPSTLSDENSERIKYLFAHDLYELPDANRPVCHQNGHTYPSVYGRMRWDVPSATITSGFMSPGRGRFIHPKLPRTLTLHEGARIQGFPDSFDFGFVDRMDISRSTLARMIADAVPPALGAIFGLAASSIARPVIPMVGERDTIHESPASYVA